MKNKGCDICPDHPLTPIEFMCYILCMRNPITRLDLPNGFHVLLKEIHTSPIVSQWIWYRVGSRDEAPGLTGASHWAEHMQFKGTPKFPSSETERAISREGGVWNAFTFLDWTAYFETMPASKLDVVMRLEADRMVNSTFDPTEVETERTVIISERKGNENDPLFKLSEQVVATAFRKHPYHHMVIGDMDDLKTMQREDLYEHYRKHYVPSNAVLTLSGDFETERVISHIRQLYEAIPAGRERPRHYHPEPLQTDERRIPTPIFFRLQCWIAFLPDPAASICLEVGYPIKHHACTYHWSNGNWLLAFLVDYKRV
jgi:zinc protease